jgi:nucleolar GTP-binding protein
MVDTPGLLDRAMEVRNDIELQAIAAIQHIGSICLFIIDPSEQCGLSMDDQLNLKAEVEELLGDVEIITVTSKADLMEPRPANWDSVLQSENEWDGEGEPQLEMLVDSLGELTMSVTHEVGVNALRLELIRRCRSKMIDEPMSLPEGWHRQ